jgi:GcrA cell cycle regulator
MGQLVPGGWTLEQSDALVEYVKSGMSYRQSAAAINERFGTSFTRNSAIGRANRIGLQAPERPKLPKAPRKKADVLRIVAGGQGSMRIIRSIKTEPAEIRCVEIVPLNLTLAELDQATQCHYIAGDDLLYCGHPKRPDSSFCTPHHFLCWEAPRNRFGARVAA